MTAPREIVVFGVGGHGRECAAIVVAMQAGGSPVRLAGFVDDEPGAEDLARIERLDAPFLGSFDEVARAGHDALFCLGIGDGRVRARVAPRLESYALDSPVLVHPDATVGPDVTLARGAVIFAGARITTNVRLGEHVHVNQNATVGHDSVLEPFVSVNPTAAVSGNVTVGAQATIGAGAVILQGIEVASESVVGASACVVRPVAAATTVKGVPAS